MTEQIGICTKSGDTLALKGVEVTARIAGLLATTAVEQRYENASAHNLEIAYTFPLPVDAVLLSFAACVGNRRHVGEVVPRQKAEERYEEAIETGHSAFRLQALGNGLHSATLGNVLAGEAVCIELEYAEPLAWNGHHLRYRLPTTLAPRYGEPQHLQPWQRPAVRLDADYALAVSVELFGELAVATVASPSHAIRLGAEPGRLKVALPAGATMDRDFILEVHATGLRSLGVTASGLDTHVAMVSLMPPAMDGGCARDTVILIDCSGSMAGDSMRHAKEGVQLALGHLQPSDRFALIGFGSNVVEFAPALQPAEVHTVQRARRFVSDLGDLGGTEMAVAVRAALRQAADRPLDILLLTDGEAWQLEEVSAEARALGARIFTVGIGAAVAEDTVRTLADQTGGACELVSPNEEMSARIERHFIRMRQPRIAALDITWPQPPLWATSPERASFAGDACTVFAAFARPVHGEFAAAIRYEDSATSVHETVRLQAGEALGSSIVRVAAAARLPLLPAAARGDWALRHQLLTDETDYIVTLERAAGERSADLPELHIVPHMLAAGWGGTGTVCSSVQMSSMPEFDVRSLRDASPDAYASFDLDSGGLMYSLPQRSASAQRSRDPMAAFLARLQRRANRRTQGGLPTTRAELHAIKLPDELLALLDQAIAAGMDESTAVLTLYAAFVYGSYSSSLGEPLGEALGKFVWQASGDPELYERFSKVLQGLLFRSHRHHTTNDIPAFLRKLAD